MFNKSPKITARLLSDRSLFARELSDLLGMGTPLLEALKFLENYVPRPSKLRSAVSVLRTEVSTGSTLAQALSKTPYFPSLWSSCLTEVPDDSLPETLRILARSEDDRAERPPELTYLVCVLVMFLGVWLFLKEYISPTLIELAKGAETKLVYLDAADIVVPAGLVVLCLLCFLSLVYVRPGYDLALLRSVPILDGLARVRRLLHSVTLARIGLATQIPEQRLVDVALSGSREALVRASAGEYLTLADVYEKEPDFRDDSLAWVVAQAQERGNLSEALELAEESLVHRCAALEKRARISLLAGFLLTLGVMVAFFALGSYGSILHLYAATAPEAFLP